MIRGAVATVERLPHEKQVRPPLDEENLGRVFQAVVAAGDLFGAPQDVEWTLADGQLVLLQSRPVTTSTSGEGDKRAWYLSLTRSANNLLLLRDRVESELLPAMDREAAELGAVKLGSLDSGELAEVIERRLQAHDRWVEVYSRDFIPLAHGIRLFGQFYNEVMRPEDPYEFMELLAATPMLSVRRNRELARIASNVRENPELRARLDGGLDRFHRRGHLYKETVARFLDDPARMVEQDRFYCIAMCLER